MGDIAQGPIGADGKYDIAFLNGKLVLTASGKLSVVEAGVSLSVSASDVIDALEKAIPGVLAKEILEAVRAGLAMGVLVAPAPAPVV